MFFGPWRTGLALPWTKYHSPRILLPFFRARASVCKIARWEHCCECELQQGLLSLSSRAAGDALLLLCHIGQQVGKLNRGKRNWLGPRQQLQWFLILDKFGHYEMDDDDDGATFSHSQVDTWCLNAYVPVSPWYLFLLIHKSRFVSRVQIKIAELSSM